MQRLSTTLLVVFTVLWLVATGLPGSDAPPSAQASANLQHSEEAPYAFFSGQRSSEVTLPLLLGILGFSGLALFDSRLRKAETAETKSSSN